MTVTSYITFKGLSLKMTNTPMLKYVQQLYRPCGWCQMKNMSDTSTHLTLILSTQIPMQSIKICRGSSLSKLLTQTNQSTSHQVTHIFPNGILFSVIGGGVWSNVAAIHMYSILEITDRTPKNLPIFSSKGRKQQKDCPEITYLSCK